MQKAPQGNRKFGLSGIQTPITIKNRNGEKLHSIAECKLSATVTGEITTDIKGAIQGQIHGLCANITPSSWQQTLTQVKDSCQVDFLELEICFPFFITKVAPVSKISGLMEYMVSFKSNTSEDGITTVLSIPITTLCPCSKEISDGGAHNQRAEAILSIHTCEHIWIEDLIETVEESASCPVYSLLKRPDEKYVTERAFANPMFVEDVVRKIAGEIDSIAAINKFSISVESFESIHKHNAYAYVDSEDLNLG